MGDDDQSVDTSSLGRIASCSRGPIGFALEVGAMDQPRPSRVARQGSPSASRDDAVPVRVTLAIAGYDQDESGPSMGALPTAPGWEAKLEPTSHWGIDAH